MQHTVEETQSIFVDHDQYCELLTSRRQLVRQDDPRKCLRGLLDTESGVCYLIEEDRLARDR